MCGSGVGIGSEITQMNPRQIQQALPLVLSVLIAAVAGSIQLFIFILSSGITQPRTLKMLTMASALCGPRVVKFKLRIKSLELRGSLFEREAWGVLGAGYGVLGDLGWVWDVVCGNHSFKN